MHHIYERILNLHCRSFFVMDPSGPEVLFWCVFVSISRVDYLETENKALGNKVLQMSNQISTLERKLQNMQFMHFAEVNVTIKNPQLNNKLGLEQY